eukprot:g30409.t1
MGCAASVQRPMTRAELPHGSDPQFDPIVQFDLNQIADCPIPRMSDGETGGKSGGFPSRVLAYDADEWEARFGKRLRGRMLANFEANDSSDASVCGSKGRHFGSHSGVARNSWKDNGAKSWPRAFQSTHHQEDDRAKLPMASSGSMPGESVPSHEVQPEATEAEQAEQAEATCQAPKRKRLRRLLEEDTAEVPAANPNEAADETSLAGSQKDGDLRGDSWKFCTPGALFGLALRGSPFGLERRSQGLAAPTPQSPGAAEGRGTAAAAAESLGGGRFGMQSDGSGKAASATPLWTRGDEDLSDLFQVRRESRKVGFFFGKRRGSSSLGMDKWNDTSSALKERRLARQCSRWSRGSTCARMARRAGRSEGPAQRRGLRDRDVRP